MEEGKVPNARNIARWTVALMAVLAGAAGFCLLQVRFVFGCTGPVIL